VEKVNGGSRGTLNALLFWALVMAGMGLLFLVVSLPVVRQRHTMEVMARQMTACNVELYDQLDRLEKERVALLCDPFYVEKLARRNLNMCRAGEMQVNITPTSYDRRFRDAEQQLITARPLGLWRVYETLGAMVEDSILRKLALVLGGLTIVAGVVMFGRSIANERA
jgi:cell division protein FtsB